MKVRSPGGYVKFWNCNSSKRMSQRAILMRYANIGWALIAWPLNILENENMGGLSHWLPACRKFEQHVWKQSANPHKFHFPAYSQPTLNTVCSVVMWSELNQCWHTVLVQPIPPAHAFARGAIPKFYISPGRSRSQSLLSPYLSLYCLFSWDYQSLLIFRWWGSTFALAGETLLKFSV